MARFTWSGRGATSAWNDAGNWTPAGVPGQDDMAVFTSANATVTGDEVAGAITALVPTSLTFTGSVTTRGLAGRASSFQADGGAKVAFTEGANLTVADRLSVGISSGATSLAFAGTTLDTQSTVIGVRAEAAGALTLGGAATWQNTGALTVGLYGEGGLSIDGGADLLAGTFGRHPQGGNIVLGQFAGANGALDASGGGNLLSVGTLSVGGVLGAASHGTGQLSVGPNSSVDAYGGITVTAGSIVSLAGGGLAGGVIDIARGATLAGSGFVSTTGGLANDGQITASGQLFLTTAITGTGTLALGAGATLGLGDADVTQSAIRFLGPGATLLLQEPPPALAGLVEGFRPGDTIVAPYVDKISFDAATDKLTMYVGDTAAGVLSLAGNYAGYSFLDSYVGSSGTITVSHHG